MQCLRSQYCSNEELNKLSPIYQDVFLGKQSTKQNLSSDLTADPHSPSPTTLELTITSKACPTFDEDHPYHFYIPNSEITDILDVLDESEKMFGPLEDFGVKTDEEDETELTKKSTWQPPRAPTPPGPYFFNRM